jgi:hypothetical protein
MIVGMKTLLLALVVALSLDVTMAHAGKLVTLAAADGRQPYIEIQSNEVAMPLRESRHRAIQVETARLKL